MRENSDLLFQNKMETSGDFRRKINYENNEPITIVIEIIVGFPPITFL